MEINYIIIDTDEKGQQYIYHTSCARRSYNPNDIKNKYCVVCHTFPDDTARRKALNESVMRAQVYEN